MTERTQRRLAAIVSADVVGYSRLMGVDEIGTLDALRKHRTELIDPLIALHGGRIVKTMGDGLLLEFPSVVDATQCAIEVQKGMAKRNEGIDEDTRITFRIGVNLGDIIIEGEDILGDGVNIAARLQEIAEPGGVSISIRVYEDVRDRLDALFEDTGEQGLKNISRPVQVWRWSPAETSTAAMLNVAADTTLPLPDKPSIAVLPFDNMSGDPEQEYFADGVTEDIITALSKIRSLFVIARNSTFVYKGQAADVRMVSENLGVRYVLEGSVRKAGDQVRISGQLIDALNGVHLWADRFQGSLDDIFELQDQVTAKVVAAVAPTIRTAEIARAGRKSVGDANAYDLYLQALARLRASDIDGAFPLLARARSIAPDFAPAYGLEAWSRTLWVYSPIEPDHLDNAAAAITLARKALELGDDDPELLGQIGYTLAFFEENVDLGFKLVREALEAAPSLSWLWASHGFLNMFFGECTESVKAFERSQRLDPRDALAYRNNFGLAGSKLMLADYAGALEAAQEAHERAPENIAVLRLIAACHAELGEMEKAKEFTDKLMNLSPGFTIGSWANNHPVRHAKNVELIRRGMRKAGLPE